MSPTRSGLAMLPAVVGIVLLSIVSGQLITKTGRYKIYPIVGAAVLIGALVRPGGRAMQTILTTVQNAVEFHDMEAATGGTTF
jgi:hypothetical protein